MAHPGASVSASLSLTIKYFIASAYGEVGGSRLRDEGAVSVAGAVDEEGGYDVRSAFVGGGGMPLTSAIDAWD